MQICVALLVLVAAFATGEAKIQAKAIPKYSVEKDGAGRFVITLDGSDSTPGNTGCLLYEWHVWDKVNGKKDWDLISRSKVRKYTVETDCKSYKFKLHVWARKDKYYPDSSIFKVPVEFDCVKKPPKPDCSDKEPKAVAEVSKIYKSDDGYKIKLDGSKSMHCDDYNWEKVGEEDEWHGDDAKETYYPASAGTHEFILKCDNNCGGKTKRDEATVKAYIKDCTEDPCDKVEASFTVTNKDDKCKFELDASASKGCKEYEWYAYKKGSDVIYIPGGKETTWKPDHTQFGNFEFLLKCINDECTKKARGYASCKDPCEDKDVEADVSASSNCEFELDASHNADCKEASWYVRVNDGPKTHISDEKEYTYKADTHGDFKFILYCKSKEGCEMKDSVHSKCSNPCKDHVIKAVIKITDVIPINDGHDYKVKLSGADSINCGNFRWGREKKGAWKPIGTGKNIDYIAAHDGNYKFQLICEDKVHDCGEVVTEHSKCLRTHMRYS